MGESLSHRQRRLRDLAGEHGKGEVWLNKHGNVLHQVKCRVCRWSSPSDGKDPGQGSAFRYALDRWSEHLVEKHPEYAFDWEVVTHPEDSLTFEQRALLWAIED